MMREERWREKLMMREKLTSEEKLMKEGETNDGG
jgi:hypothetical protein